MKFFKSNTFYFLLFVFANLLLKLLFIDHYSFSYDEMISVKNTQLNFGHIKHEAEWDNNPPFYYYCLWVWSSIFNVGEFNVRLLSAIFIALAIGFNFVLVRKELNFTTAIISSTFLSLSAFITFYAQEARTYSLIFLLAILSSILFFNFLKKPGLINLFLLGLVNFLIIYSHYIASLIIVAQYAFILFFERKYLVKIFVFQTLFIALLVYLRFTKKQFANIFGFNNKGDFWLQPATVTDLKSSLSELFFSWYFLLAAVIISLLVFIIRNHFIKQEQKKFLYYCLFAGFFSFIFLFTIGTFKSVFLSRYLIFAIPFVIAFVVFLISEIKPVGVVLSAALLIFPALSFNLKPLKGQDYREISGIVKGLYDKESCVLVNTEDNTNLFLYYFDRNGFDIKSKRDSVLLSNRIFGVNDTNKIDELRITGYKTVFLVQSFNKKVDNKDIIQLYLKHKYAANFNTQQFYGTDFSVFKNR